jgi:gamma-glutamylcyclotransferase (GGCT)/AIG2-like uncharacterized protein YtfP
VGQAPQRIIAVLTTERDRLFVYGSLKRGGRHHAELGGAAFLGEARTAPGYGLEAVGEYWALVERPGLSGSVSGELFEVDEPLLARLDQFEGDDYRRGVVRLASGAAVLVGQSTASRDVGEISLALAYLKKTR